MGQQGTATATCYLVITNTTTSGAVYRSAKVSNMTRTPPSLDKGEFAIKVSIDIPYSALDNPYAEVVLQMPAAPATTPTVTVEPVNLDLSKGRS